MKKIVFACIVAAILVISGIVFFRKKPDFLSEKVTSVDLIIPPCHKEITNSEDILKLMNLLDSEIGSAKLSIKNPSGWGTRIIINDGQYDIIETGDYVTINGKKYNCSSDLGAKMKEMYYVFDALEKNYIQ